MSYANSGNNYGMNLPPYNQPNYLVSIPLFEYEILQRCRQENYALHERLFQLTASNQTLQDTLKNREEIILARDKTIEELKRENEELKARIAHLETNNQELNDKNSILSSKVENLENELTTTQKKLDTTTQELALTKAELTSTKEELKSVRSELDTIKSNKLLMKFIMGLQDLNSWEKLEKKVDNPQILIRLRRNRVGECHYIDNDYEIIEKEIRRNILIDKLNDSDDIKKMLDSMFPNLLDTLTPYLAKRELQITLGQDNNDTVSISDIEDITQWANKWWDF